MTYYQGHQSQYGYFVRFNTGSFGVSSSIGDIYVNDYLIQNQEFLYAMSSQVKVNVSRHIEPLFFVFEGSGSYCGSVGPFELDFLPDGRPQPLYVSIDASIVDTTNTFATGAITVHLRQAALKPGTFYSYSEYGVYEGVGKTGGFVNLTVSASSHPNILEIDPRSLGPLNTRQSYVSRSVSSSKEAIYELPVYLDIYCKLTGSQAHTDDNGLSIYGIYAHSFVPRISGSWIGPNP